MLNNSGKILEKGEGMLNKEELGQLNSNLNQTITKTKKKEKKRKKEKKKAQTPVTHSAHDQPLFPPFFSLSSHSFPCSGNPSNPAPEPLRLPLLLPPTVTGLKMEGFNSGINARRHREDVTEGQGIDK